MGQKVNPIGFRLGIVERWRSVWFADDKNFKHFLREDLDTKKFLNESFPRGTVTKIEIEKVAEKIRVILHSPRPGVVLGRKGSEINRVKEALYGFLQKQVTIDVNEIKNPGLDAMFLADSIAQQLERRVPHRICIKKAMALAMQSGALGIKVRVGGRLGGAEISRSEQYKEGKVPLHTLRAKINYGTATAVTKFGCIGVKVWIFVGEIFGPESAAAVQTQLNKAPAGAERGRGKRSQGSTNVRRRKNAAYAKKDQVPEDPKGTDKGEGV